MDEVAAARERPGLRETVPMRVRSPDGAERQATLAMPAAGSVRGPLVSGLMVTRGDRPQAALAIDGWRRQSYRRRELVILCDRAAPAFRDWVARLEDPSIRLIDAEPAPLGTLRNAAVAAARGELVCQWDDDDLHHPLRLELQLAALAAVPGAAASFLTRWTMWQPARRRLAVSRARLWEGTMLLRRAAFTAYPAQALAEDTVLVDALRGRETLVGLNAPWAYLYVAHGRNSWPEPQFDMLFAGYDHADADPHYDEALARIGRTLPVAAYLRALGASAAPGR